MELEKCSLTCSEPGKFSTCSVHSSLPKICSYSTSASFWLNDIKPDERHPIDPIVLVLYNSTNEVFICLINLRSVYEKTFLLLASERLLAMVHVQRIVTGLLHLR